MDSYVVYKLLYDIQDEKTDFLQWGKYENETLCKEEREVVVVCTVSPAKYEHNACQEDVGSSLPLDPLHFDSFEKNSNAFYKMNESRVQRLQGKYLQLQR